MKSILWSFMWNLQNHSCIKCSGFAPGDEHMNICSLGPVWYTTCFHVRIKVVRCKMLTGPLLINQPMGQEHLYQRFYPCSVHFATQKWMQLPNCSLNPIRTHIKIPWNSSLKFIKTSGVFHVFHVKAQQGVGNEARAADEMHLLLAQLPIWEALKDPGWIYPSEKKRMYFLLWNKNMYHPNMSLSCSLVLYGFVFYFLCVNSFGIIQIWISLGGYFRISTWLSLDALRKRRFWRSNGPMVSSGVNH